MVHADRKHATLSASGASRWLNCPPSALLEQKFKESGTSVYAAEGTLAHELADVKLRHFAGEITKRKLNAEVRKIEKNDLYTPEMPGEVQKYVDFVVEEFKAVKAKDADAVLIIEERLDFSHIVPQGFGTGDAIILGGGNIQVIDLKYGRGVKVDAANNSQLRLYAVGALNEFGFVVENIRTVITRVMQPRLDHVSSEELSVEELTDWAEKIVKPTAAQAAAGQGKQKAGEHCRWCKAKGLCRTLAEYNTVLAKHDFKDPQLLSKEEQSEIFAQIPMLTDWAQSVAAHMLDSMQKGEKYEGLKLVEGRSLRKWIDEDTVREYLNTKGFTSEDYDKVKLRGIGDIEKLVTKPVFAAECKTFYEKPQGKPTIAPVTDKRPALNTAEDAAKDFEN